jgi:hypothetical protein
LECRELDKVIAHYRELRRHVTDRLTLQGIDLLKAEAEAKKRALHWLVAANVISDLRPVSRSV